MTLDPKTEIELTNSLTEARDSIKNLENTTKRIHNIINEVPDDGDRRRPLRSKNKRKDDELLSPRFVTVTVIILVIVMGFFGMLFFQHTTTTLTELDIAIAKVAKIEQRVGELETTQVSRSVKK